MFVNSIYDTGSGGRERRGQDSPDKGVHGRGNGPRRVVNGPRHEGSHCSQLRDEGAKARDLGSIRRAPSTQRC
jgi:hypothetical protein